MDDMQLNNPFKVIDLTGEVETKYFDDVTSGRKWIRHLFQWRTNSRCVIEINENTTVPCDKCEQFCAHIDNMPVSEIKDVPRTPAFCATYLCNDGKCPLDKAIRNG